ncbi:MAG: hypothetical protein MJK18_07790, partial [Bdellovibrionales bacterium]|nr:hypothetical protein [Bdellovibrionales bacterium]
ADDLLNVLDGSTKSDGLSIEKKSSIFKGLVARPSAEQNIFFQFLEKGDDKKALYQWPSAFENSSFAATDNGKALYGYLLYRNGLEITGLEKLFTARPTKIKKKLVGLWRGLMQTNEELWTFADIEWNNQWTEIFGLPAEVAVISRRFDKDLTTQKLEELLRKTTKNTWERSWTEWRFVTNLLFKGEDVKAAKLLKHLQGVKSNNPISTNLMNLTAARMLYQNGYLTEAIRYYEKIEKSSDYWFEAQEEIAWSYLRLGQSQNTLASSMTLMTPDFTADVGPEVFYLSSLANLKVCDYASVSRTLQDFRTRFQKKAQSLINIKNGEDTKSIGKLVSILRKGRARMTDLGGEGIRLPRHSTRDEALFFMVQRNKKLDREAKRASELYSQSLSEGTALVGFQAKMEKFKKFVESRARNSYTSSVNRIQQLAATEITEIHDVLKKMQIVEAELIQQLAMVDRVIEETKNKVSKVKKGTTGSQSDDSLSFPYQGEIWFDEIANYRIDIAKGCQSGKGTTL